MLAVALACSCSEKKEQRSVKPVKVKTTVVGTTMAAGSQAYSGTIEEQSGTTLSFASVGTVQNMCVDEGQWVKKGQLIGLLDDTSVRQAYEAAKATREQAEDALERMKLLHENGSLPEIKWIEVQTQVKQAQASEQIAQKALADTRLLAPFSGYIAKKDIETGQNAAPGVSVVKLVRIDQVKVKINIPEEDIADTRKGQSVTVTVEALGNRSFVARISEKGVQADPITRSYEVKATLDNPRHELLPGMLCCVLLDGDAAERTTIVLPAQVIQIDADNQPFVWTVKGSKAVKTPLRLGGNAGQGVEVTDGVTPGDSVIVNGQQKVSAGMEVKAI